MKYRSRPITVEANLFEHPATAPIGVYVSEEGFCYVITIQGEAVEVHPGEYIVLEDPPGDGTRAYPCCAEVFHKRYEVS